MYLELRLCLSYTTHIIGYCKYPLSELIQGFGGINSEEKIYNRYGKEVCSIKLKGAYEKTEKIYEEVRNVK